MLKIKDNVTLKQLKEYNFEITNYELLYKIKKGCYLAFEFNTKSDDYLYFIGLEMFNTMENATTTEKDLIFEKLEYLGLVEKVKE